MPLPLLPLLLSSLLCGPPAAAITIDRDVLAEFLEKKNLQGKPLAFDLDHMASMPAANIAHHAHPKRENGKLELFVDSQREPVTFPERMQELAARCAQSLPDLFAAADETLGRKPREVKLPDPQPVTGLPEKVALAVGRIHAAMRTKDPATIARVVLEAQPDLVHTGVYDREGLTIDFEGDDTHTFEKMATGVRVFIDVAGNDRYEGHVAAANHGIDLVFDFAGNDTYVSTEDFAQAAAVEGTALLYDAAGDDTYTLRSSGQAYAKNGVAALVDVAGNDTYELTHSGQGYGLWGGFALLVDLAGNDSYLGHDPLYGHPVTIPAPQDEKHNANMVQGAGHGDRGDPKHAGGIGILLDAHGDDTYRAGCWSQGVGYFCGLGALLDLEGNDSYQSWVYVNGTGAHGGFGLQVDAQGDDVYNVGGWNGLGMAVDYGMGMFLDGAGNDRYVGGSNCFGSSVGLGIALFEDRGGDDDYSGTRDRKFGFGRWYEKEDYNSDGQVTPPEKRHWGIFLDLGGMDRYPKGPKEEKNIQNGTRWDPGEFCGGIDRPTPPDPLVARAGVKDWEDSEPAALFAELRKLAKTPEDLLALSKFGFAHGCPKEAGEALFEGGGQVPGSAWEPTLKLWIAERDREWGTRLVELRARLAKAPVDELLAAKPLDGPAWVTRESRELAAAAAAERKAALLLRVQRWTESLKPFEERRAALDDARVKDEKRLRALWAARRQGSVRVEAAAREAAKDLDRFDPKWREACPLASNLSEEAIGLDNFTRTVAERAALTRSRDVEKANEAAKQPFRRFAEEVNALRAMHGVGSVALDATLSKCAEAGVKAGKPDPATAGERAKAAGFDGAVREATTKVADPTAAVEALDRKLLLDPGWTDLGLCLSAQGNWWVAFGKPAKQK